MDPLRRHLARGAVLAAIALSLAGCKTRASLDVVLGADGAGTLTLATELDDEAVRLAGRPPPAMTKRFRDLAELESWFETPGEPDMIRWHRNDARLDIRIDLPTLMRRIAGDQGSEVLDAALANLRAKGEDQAVEEQADIRFRVHVTGRVVDHNADRAPRDGWFEWRLWPVRDRPATLAIDLSGPNSPARPRSPLLGMLATAGVAVVAAVGGFCVLRYCRDR